MPKPNTEWDKKKYYRWTIKIPRQKWQALTTSQQAEVKKRARAVILEGTGEEKSNV